MPKPDTKGMRFTVTTGKDDWFINYQNGGGQLTFGSDSRLCSLDEDLSAWVEYKSPWRIVDPSTTPPWKFAEAAFREALVVDSSKDGPEGNRLDSIYVRWTAIMPDSHWAEIVRVYQFEEGVSIKCAWEGGIPYEAAAALGRLLSQGTVRDVISSAALINARRRGK